MLNLVAIAGYHGSLHSGVCGIGDKRRFSGAFAFWVTDFVCTRVGDGVKFAGEWRWLSVSCSDLLQLFRVSS
ncbi:hypothetical protein EDWATA_00913 [Edwardsiella tarda ATCC 23685]|uniref:Uncharacterized protein n=1 Tax=Edwardsiella tarda ATCC 23685 TaxID=500638 RepID=D4F2G3_EDWTA|nr:hypothetical protein EDWATA_00913 [Edwardsiella tarda ATCC 23685]